MPQALIHPEGDPPFPAEVVELRPNSILLRSERALDFRSKVLVEVVGARLRGEVVYSNDGQLAVTFPVAAEIFDIIEAVDAALDAEPRQDPAPDVMAAIDEALALFASADLPTLGQPETLTSTVDLPDAKELPSVPAPHQNHLLIRDGAVEVPVPAEALGVCLLFHAGRSVVARVEGWLPSTVHLIVPDGPVALDATFLFEGWASLQALDRESLHHAIHALQPALRIPEPPRRTDTLVFVEPSEEVRVTEDLPVMSDDPSGEERITDGEAVGSPSETPRADGYPILDDDDRTVRFSSHEQFVAQYEENLSKQALVVQMMPIATTATRAFVLAVPGASPIEVLARAVFPRDDSVGFALERFDSIRGQLKALAEGTAPPSPVDSSASKTSHQTIDGYDGPLTPPEDPKALMELKARRPESLFDVGGSYLRTLDFVFGRRLDCVLEVREVPTIIRIWIQAGRVVFASREPEKGDGRLGRRLLADRAISQRGLLEALELARTSGQALGSLLIEQGMLRREDLNRALRAQTVERLTAPIGFDRGTLRIQPWFAPPVQARWFPVSGDALLAEAIRERLRHITAEELESKLFDDLGRDVIVDLSAIEPRYRIREKEHRVYSRAATTPLPLRHLSRFVSAGQIESLRLVILGAALGFVRLGETRSDDASTHTFSRPHQSASGLEQRLKHLEEVDHFEALGVHWAAPHHEIIVAYKREIHLLNKLPRQSDARSRELARRLRDRIELAFKRVGNRSHRITYRSRVIPPEQLENAGEHLLDQAELAVVRERADEADSHLDMAEELLGARAVRRLREAVRELRAGF